jgi:hypothetical protein
MDDSSAAFHLTSLFKSLEIRMGSVSPSPIGSEYLRLCLDIKQPMDPAKAAALIQYIQSSLADRKITVQEFLGLILLAVS